MNKLHRQKQIHLEQWEYDMIIDKVKKKAKKDVFDDIDRILGQDDWCYIVNKEHYAKIKKKHLKKSNTN